MASTFMLLLIGVNRCSQAGHSQTLMAYNSTTSSHFYMRLGETISNIENSNDLNNQK